MTRQLRDRLQVANFEPTDRPVTSAPTDIQPASMDTNNTPTPVNSSGQAIAIDPLLDSSKPYQLDELVDLALRQHPTLHAAAARIEATQHEATQARLAPNPKLSFFADEVGNEDDLGLLGIFIQRKIIRGNKLALSGRVKDQLASLQNVESEILAVRIETDVRMAFYQFLITEQKLILAEQLRESQQRASQQARKLFDAGETPRTDLLQTKLQVRQSEMMVRQIELQLENAWRKLAVVVGNPKLEPRPLEGSLDEVIEPIDIQSCRESIFSLSPELRAANAEIERIKAVVERARAEAIPDYQTQFTVGKDSATEHFFVGAQVQVPLMICDRNQGNIAAAEARLVEASHNIEKIKLKLSRRLIEQFQSYESARVNATMIQEELIPQSQANLKLLTMGYPEEVEFLQVLSAQKTVVEFTIQYLNALETLWLSRLKIEGLLLDASLEQ